MIQMMPRFEDQENMDDEEMELVLNAIEYIKGSNQAKIHFRFQLNFRATLGWKF